tara:strand:+ start:826 stop:1896 length:1071 start_codon:yes stop_codon:yes gene_type:complete
MKVLLLGDLSGLHKNLKSGLHECGLKNIDLATNGDGYKKIYGDIILPKPRNYSIYSRLKYRYEFINTLSKVKGYDIVQIAGPYIFPFPFFPYRNLIQNLKRNNGKIFLCACGSDSFYWEISRKILSYGPFDETIKYDLNGVNPKQNSVKGYNFNKYLADNVDGIIAVSYEYFVAYKDHINFKSFIPQPIFLKSVQNKKFEIEKKINVFHGLSRYGLKGTRHIEKALEKLKKKYPDRVNIKIEGRMPLDKYLQKILNSHIVIDQCYSYSYGMNALYSMAMEKLVFSGSEEDIFSSLGVDSIPVVNILPNSEYIFETLSYYVEKPSLIEELSQNSRKYVERFHNASMIANEYLKQWSL